MNVLGITGSPRRGGNTEILMEEALRSARAAGCATDIFLMSGRRVAPCDACGGCVATGECVVGDDMRELSALMARADGIVFGSPVYFGSVSAQLKAVMDRTFAQLQRRSLEGKAAGALVATRRVGAAQARSLIYAYAIAQGMLVAGGAIGYGREPGDVRTGTGGGIGMSALEEAGRLGAAVAALALRLRS